MRYGAPYGFIIELIHIVAFDTCQALKSWMEVKIRKCDSNCDSSWFFKDS